MRRELDELAAERRPHARIVLDYGFPEERETPCGTMSLTRLYVDAWGRLSTCCQLSDYGFNTAEVVADLHQVPLADAVATFEQRVGALARASAPRSDTLAERFPCLRCARSSGKLDWLRDHARSPWAPMLADDGSTATHVV